MPGFTAERSGYTSVAALATAMIQDLKDHGFIPKYYNLGALTDGAVTATKATFEAGPSVDSLQGSQPWRLMIDGTGTALTAYWGTGAQLTDAGAVGAAPSSALSNGSTAGFTYRLTISPRGLMVMVWLSSTSAGNCGLLVVQRPVNPTTGAALTGNYAPVMCLTVPFFSGAPYPQAGIVREQDVTVPTPLGYIGATSGSAGARGGLVLHDGVPQPAPLLSDGSYPLFFPSLLATNRYMYIEQLDLIAFAPEVAYPLNTDVMVSMYGEGAQRTYRALPRLSANGIRPLVLTVGGGL